MQIDPCELAKIPYLKADTIGNREVNLAPLWDGQRLHVYMPDGSGGLTLSQPTEQAMGGYVSKEPARLDDIHLPFLEFAWQRASWKGVSYWATAIEHDLHLLGAAVGKIDFFWGMREKVPGGGLGATQFVASELEYVIVVCRSVLDELQEFLRALWQRIRLLDPAGQRRKRELCGSMADMVMAKNKCLSADDIHQRRRIPLPLAAVYASAGDFIHTLRDLRTGLVHGGKNVPMVFATERGFGIRRDEPHFSDLGIWKPVHHFNDEVVSLRPALAHLVMTTLYICNAFTDVLGRMIEFPPELAPGYHFFIRCIHGDALVRLHECDRGGSAWWD